MLIAIVAAESFVAVDPTRAVIAAGAAFLTGVCIIVGRRIVRRHNEKGERR